MDEFMMSKWRNKLNVVCEKVRTVDQTQPTLRNLLPGVFYRLDLRSEHHIVDLGEGIADLLGYKREELLNKRKLKSHLQAILPGHEDLLSQKKRLCNEDRQVKKVVYYLYTKSQSTKLIEDRFIGEYDRKGRLIAINGYLKEVKKSNVKIQLLNQLEAYRAAIDVNIISSITDTQGTIIYANDNFKRISQYSDEELLGKNHRIVNSGYHTKEFFKQMWATISSGKMWQGEIRNRAKDGSLYWVDTVIIPVFDNRQKIGSYLSLRLLITDRKLAEQLKAKYVKVVEEIAHMVAHDLRGPVSTILGLANVVNASGCGDHEMNLVKDYVVKAANKLDQITRDFSAKIYLLDTEVKNKELKSSLDL